MKYRISFFVLKQNRFSCIIVTEERLSALFVKQIQKWRMSILFISRAWKAMIRTTEFVEKHYQIVSLLTVKAINVFYHLECCNFIKKTILFYAE